MDLLFRFRGGIANFNNALAQEYYHERGDDVTFFILLPLQYPRFFISRHYTVRKWGSHQKDLKIKTLINSVNPFNWVKVARKINAEKIRIMVIIRYWLPFMAPCLGSIARLLKSRRLRFLAITDNVIPHEKRIGDTLFTKLFC